MGIQREYLFMPCKGDKEEGLQLASGGSGAQDD